MWYKISLIPRKLKIKNLSIRICKIFKKICLVELVVIKNLFLEIVNISNNFIKNLKINIF